MTQSRQRANWRWMLPILMLILAALACDEPYIDPPHVVWVDVDANVPGHAFIYVTSETSAVDVYYETRDYGQHWSLTDQHPQGTHIDSPPFIMSGESLLMDGKAIWSFPRPIFRFFFFDDSTLSGSQFRLPYGNVSASLQGDRLYVAMGTEGVLVGRLTTAGTLVDWQLTSTGIDTIHPLPLTITEPAEILGVTAFALFVPPFALLHAFLLYCLWVYLLPRDRARRYAIFTSLGLMVVAAVGIVLWLTDMRTDYFPVVAVVAAITALTGVSLTLIFANEQPDAPQKIWLVLWSLLASLIVPAGVASIFTGWWAVYGVVLGYLFFRRVYYRYFQPEDGIWRERWRVDLLALETVGISVLILIAITMIIGLLSGVYRGLGGYHMENFLQLIGLIVTVGVTIVLVGRYTAWRLGRVVKAKRDDAASQNFPSGSIRVATLAWMVATLVLSGATFVGQMVAYGWFTSLLTVPFSSAGG